MRVRSRDAQRYFCQVLLDERPIGEGRGGSRRNAEQEAARQALNGINDSSGKENNTSKPH